MIDRISFIIPGGVAPSLVVEKSEDDKIIGKYKNFRVTMTPEGLFCTGSITKYYHGENVTNLSHDELIGALCLLQEDTGWDISQAKVVSIEIGASISVTHTVSLYLQGWERISRFKIHETRGRQLETVLLSNSSRSFQAYNKRKESKRSPGAERGDHIVRLELKLKKGIRRYMGRDLYLSDLADILIYKSLLSLWSSTYFSIPKFHQASIGICGRTSPKELGKYLQKVGLQTIGHSYFDNIDRLQEDGHLDRVQASRARQSAKKLLMEPYILSSDNAYIKELDEKVRWIVEHCGNKDPSVPFF